MGQKKTNARDMEDSFPVVGVASTFKASKKHVILADAETEEFEEVADALERSRFETYSIARSSEDGFHVVIPVIQDRDSVDAFLDVFGPEDPKHRDIGYKRSAWILRISPKEGVGKGKPELVASAQDIQDDRDYSKTHMEFFNAVYDAEPFNVPDRPNVKHMGPIRVERYWTWK